MGRRSIMCMVFLLGWLLSVPHLARGQAVPPTCVVPSVIGAYTLTGNPAGLLVIDSQSGTAIAGRYGADGNALVNTIQGTIQCTVLSGTFKNTQYSTEGTFQYTFSDDG